MPVNSHKSLVPSIVLGSALLLFGILLLLPAFGVDTINVSWRWWPLILVAIGAGEFVNAENSRKRGEGIWTMFIGCWLLVSFLRVWGLGFATSWPILVVGIGIRMIWKSIERRERVPSTQETFNAH